MTTAEAVLDPGLNGSVEARKQVKKLVIYSIVLEVGQAKKNETQKR